MPDDPKPSAAPKIRARGLNFFYGKFQALHAIDMDIATYKVTAFIGPSGCGKSTFLRTFNRMNETIPSTRVEGELQLDGANILDMDVTGVRRRIGMVFQKSNPFPKTIFDNVAYGLRINGTTRRSEVEAAVEKSLQRAALWTRSKTSCKSPPVRFPAASNSVSVLPVLWP